MVGFPSSTPSEVLVPTHFPDKLPTICLGIRGELKISIKLEFFGELNSGVDLSNNVLFFSCTNKLVHYCREADVMPACSQDSISIFEVKGHPRLCGGAYCRRWPGVPLEGHLQDVSQFQRSKAISSLQAVRVHSLTISKFGQTGVSSFLSANCVVKLEIKLESLVVMQCLAFTSTLILQRHALLPEAMERPVQSNKSCQIELLPSPRSQYLPLNLSHSHKQRVLLPNNSFQPLELQTKRWHRTHQQCP